MHIIFCKLENHSFPLVMPQVISLLHPLVIPHLQNDYNLDKCILFSVYLYHAIYNLFPILTLLHVNPVQVSFMVVV